MGNRCRKSDTTTRITRHFARNSQVEIVGATFQIERSNFRTQD